MAKKLAARNLDRRITLQSSTTSVNDVGDTILTWVDEATVWAGLRDANANETFEGERLEANVTTEFVIRFLDGIDATWRVVYYDAIYEIHGVMRVDRGRFLRLLTEKKDS
jgi:SPP1 family predicted phage head-tail adaptor